MSSGVRPTNALAVVDVDLVRPNPRNIRRDLGSLVDLTESIRSEGILQPLVVEDRGDHFLVIAGHRLLHLPAQAQQMVRARELGVGPATQLARQVKKSGRGAVNPAPKVERCDPHFTDTHPLAKKARLRCDLAGHPAAGRLGTSTTHNRACGSCWELEIRQHALRIARPSPALPAREDPTS